MAPRFVSDLCRMCIGAPSLSTPCFLPPGSPEPNFEPFRVQGSNSKVGSLFFRPPPQKKKKKYCTVLKRPPTRP